MKIDQRSYANISNCSKLFGKRIIQKNITFCVLFVVNVIKFSFLWESLLFLYFPNFLQNIGIVYSKENRLTIAFTFIEQFHANLPCATRCKTLPTGCVVLMNTQGYISYHILYLFRFPLGFGLFDLEILLGSVYML